MKKEIEAFVNAANEQELEAAWNNLSAEEQRVFEQLMEEEPPEDSGTDHHGESRSHHLHRDRQL